MSAEVLEMPFRLATNLLPLKLETFFLRETTTIPNSRLPVLIYRNAVKLPKEDAAWIFEEFFTWNHWHNTWRDGIYPFHHYHSTAHEALGVFSGSASVQFGGEFGVTQTLKAGDLVVIPAGVAHKNLGAQFELGVVGAYPLWEDWDMNYGRPGERPRVDLNIARVLLPETDPLYGPQGPLLKHWR